MQRGPDASTLVAFVGFVLLAGANGTAISFINRGLAPFWGASLRFIPAALVFIALALAARRPFPRGRALVGVVLYGLLAFAGTFGPIYWALQYVKPGIAQVILALAPLLTLLLAVAQRQERFRWAAFFGALACLAGIAYVFRAQLRSAVPLSGLLAILLAALSLAEGTVAAKRFPKADILTTNVVAMGVAGVVLLALSFAVHEPHALPQRGDTWIAAAYILVAGSVAAFALFLFVLQRWSASAAAYQWVLLPFVAVPLSAWLTGERVTSALLIGGIVVLVGVYFGAIRPSGSARKTTEAARAPAPPTAK
ncbi:MAG: DMT family transporter [Thermoplasmatota archaeon]